MKPAHISYSQITTYQSCALKYHLKYRTGIKGKRDEDTSPALTNGIKVHKAVELLIKGGETEEIEKKLNKEQRTMFMHWRHECMPSLPTGCTPMSEKKLEATWAGWPLLGYLDMLWFEDNGHTAYICDIKTGNNLFYLPDKAWFSLQPDIYSILVHLNYPDVETVYWQQHNVSAEGANVTQREVQWTGDRELVLDTWLRRMDRDDALPHESWECGRCPYADMCRGRIQSGQAERFKYYETEENSEEAECGEQ